MTAPSGHLRFASTAECEYLYKQLADEAQRAEAVASRSESDVDERKAVIAALFFLASVAIGALLLYVCTSLWGYVTVGRYLVRHP